MLMSPNESFACWGNEASGGAVETEIGNDGML
jgi:hypothetical protein